MYFKYRQSKKKTNGTFIGKCIMVFVFNVLEVKIITHSQLLFFPTPYRDDGTCFFPLHARL